MRRARLAAGNEAGELNRHADGRRLREKTGERCHDARLLCGTCRCDSLLRQAIKPPNSIRCARIEMRVGLPLFPVRKSCGEPCFRGSRKVGATREPSLRTKG